MRAKKTFQLYQQFFHFCVRLAIWVIPCCRACELYTNIFQASAFKSNFVLNLLQQDHLQDYDDHDLGHN